MTSGQGLLRGNSTLIDACRQIFAGVIVAFSLAGAIGCDVSGLFLDEGNLEKVANHYYRPGKKNGLPRSASYKFLSEQSKKQVREEESEEEFEMVNRIDNNIDSSVKVLGEKDSGGRKYAVVSVSYGHKGNNGKILRFVRSGTWVLENGKWRRLFLPSNYEETYKAFLAGDYAAAKSKAEELLAADPFSVFAYKHLGFGIERSNAWSFKRGDRSKADILRAMLAINPEDTTVLFCAATWSENLSIAKTYLKKLEGTGQYSDAAYNVSLKIDDPVKKLGFFEGLEMTPFIAIQKLLALSRLDRRDEFLALAPGDGEFGNLKADLDGKDAAFAARLSADLGMSFHKFQDDATARQWLEYGITRDPNCSDLNLLANLLESQSRGRRVFRGSR